MENIEIPHEVKSWINDVFASCNSRITQKLCNIPNVHEPSLDMTFIEHFSQLASPKIFASNWIVRIDTHYLGGLRHFNRWEIADIGLLLFFRRGGKILKSKVCLLQSKRLYPTNEVVREDLRIDYEIGFARLADPEDTAVSLSHMTEFNFDDSCRYAAILTKDQQYEAIKQYYQEKGIPVYYQFYNPAFIPFTQTTPLTNYASPEQDLVLGTRIIPATNLHRYLDQKDKGFKPTLGEMKNLIINENFHYGWSLEFFATELFMGCTEGYVFENIDDERIQSMFYRRSGPISAAIAISIELPE